MEHKYVECNRFNTEEMLRKFRLALSNCIKNKRKQYMVLPQGAGKTYNALDVAFDLVGSEHVLFLSPTIKNIEDYERKFNGKKFYSMSHLKVWTMLRNNNYTGISDYKLDWLVNDIKRNSIKVVIIDECHEITSSKVGYAIKSLVNELDVAVIGLSPYSIRLTCGLTSSERDYFRGVFEDTPAFMYDYDTCWRNGILGLPLIATAITENMDDVCKNLYDRVKGTFEGSNVKIHDIKRFIRDKASTGFNNYMLKGALEFTSSEKCIPSKNHFITSNEQLTFWLFSKGLPTDTEGYDNEYCSFNLDCENVQKQLAEFYNIDKSDIKIYKVHSKAPKELDIVSEYNNDTISKIKILASVDMLNKGIHPENLTATILCRHTESVELLLQMSLREARIFYKKRPVIIDLVDTSSYINCIQEVIVDKKVKRERESNEIYRQLQNQVGNIITDVVQVSQDIAFGLHDNTSKFINESVKLASLMSSKKRMNILLSYRQKMLYSRDASKYTDKKLFKQIADEFNEDESLIKVVISSFRTKGMLSA